MKLDEARKHYYDHSGAASSSARQLAFAGIAVIWILVTVDSVVSVPSTVLRLPLFTFIAALAFDLVQYYWLAGFWGAFSRIKEVDGEDEFEGAPEWGNYIGIICFWVKGASVAIGYIILFVLLWPIFLR